MRLRFLFDEDTKNATARYLSKEGHDVERVVEVSELGPGSSDREVMSYAHSSNRIIVTHDDDYVDPDLRTDHSGVFYFPNQRRSAFEEFTIIVSALDSYPERESLPVVLYLTDEWL